MFDAVLNPYFEALEDKAYWLVYQHGPEGDEFAAPDAMVPKGNLPAQIAAMAQELGPGCAAISDRAWNGMELRFRRRKQRSFFRMRLHPQCILAFEMELT